jgi:hypothetical protein
MDGDRLFTWSNVVLEKGHFAQVALFNEMNRLSCFLG